jgi:hypothetical protein
MWGGEFDLCGLFLPFAVPWLVRRVVLSTRWKEKRSLCGVARTRMQGCETLAELLPAEARSSSEAVRQAQKRQIRWTNVGSAVQLAEAEALRRVHASANLEHSDGNIAETRDAKTPSTKPCTPCPSSQPHSAMLRLGFPRESARID